jgi:hypothetical protein
MPRRADEAQVVRVAYRVLDFEVGELCVVYSVFAPDDTSPII